MCLILTHTHTQGTDVKQGAKLPVNCSVLCDGQGLSLLWVQSLQLSLSPAGSSCTPCQLQTHFRELLGRSSPQFQWVALPFPPSPAPQQKNQQQMGSTWSPSQGKLKAQGRLGKAAVPVRDVSIVISGRLKHCGTFHLPFSLSRLCPNLLPAQACGATEM